MDVHLNKLHRYVGITIAPLMAVQTVSGLLLDFGLFRRGGGTGGEGGAAPMRSGWDAFLVKAHFGPGFVSDAYHLVLGVGILWMACSGGVMYWRIRRRLKMAATRQPAA